MPQKQGLSVGIVLLQESDLLISNSVYCTPVAGILHVEQILFVRCGESQSFIITHERGKRYGEQVFLLSRAGYFIRSGKYQRILTISGCIVIALCAIWRYISYLSSSSRIFHQFVAAVERKDVDIIYALTIDEEKTKLGVTKDRISTALNETLYKGGSQVRSISSSLDASFGERADAWHMRAIAWVDASTGKPLFSRHQSGQLQTIVDLRRSEDGRWQVSFTRFVHSYSVMNFLRPLVDGGASKQEIRQERQRQHLLLTRWGFPKMLPNPPITRRQGRIVVIRPNEKGE